MDELDYENQVKIIIYEMVETGELTCDCSDCDCQLIADIGF